MVMALKALPLVRALRISAFLPQRWLVSKDWAMASKVLDMVLQRLIWLARLRDTDVRPQTLALKGLGMASKALDMALVLHKLQNKDLALANNMQSKQQIQMPFRHTCRHINRLLLTTRRHRLSAITRLPLRLAKLRLPVKAHMAAAVRQSPSLKLSVT